MANLGEILAGALKRKAEKPSATTIVLDTMRVPSGFREIRKRMIDYYKNPAQFIDETSIRIYGNCGEFRIKPLSEVIGADHLGSGAFGDVYRVGNKALKIIKEEDQSYASFVRFIRTEGHKYSCFPKIFYSGTWGNKTVYIIELMEQTSDDNEAERQFISDKAREIFRYKKGSKPNRFCKLPEDFSAGILALREYYDKYREKDNLGEDMHRGNVMIKEDGTPVITDPFC